MSVNFVLNTMGENITITSGYEYIIAAAWFDIDVGRLTKVGLKNGSALNNL